MDTFEGFLGTKYKTTKRFGVDGGEAAVVGINATVQKAVAPGDKEVSSACRTEAGSTS